MKHDLTTGTWQDDTGCPISIILVSTSDGPRGPSTWRWGSCERWARQRRDLGPAAGGGGRGLQGGRRDGCRIVVVVEGEEEEEGRQR